jgi:DNA-binding NarL/FixJ family response regulator
MKIRILLVDDSEIFRHLLRTALEHSTDWEVCGEAENGEVAIAKVAELKPDAVILDFAMPVMNGLDAAERIRQLAPQTPIVMVTLHEPDMLLDRARAVGVRDVIPKSDGITQRIVSSFSSILSLSDRTLPPLSRPATFKG